MDTESEENVSSTSTPIVEMTNPEEGLQSLRPPGGRIAQRDKAQLRVLDVEGKPVNRTTLNLKISTRDGGTSTLQATTGPTGYATVDLTGIDMESVEKISVEPITGGGGTTFDPENLLENGASALSLGKERDHYAIPDSALEDLGTQPFTLPPDISDVESAPELFNPKVIERNGNCSIDFTAKVDVHERFFNQIVRMESNSEREESRTEANRRELTGQIPFRLTKNYPHGDEPIDEEQPYLEHVSQPTFGVLNVYKQTWTRVGHSVGKLLHSLTLAPCESTEVSIVEWSRTERGRREERTTTRERKSHELHRDRMIQEIVEGVVKEDQWGSSTSFQGGVGASGGIAGLVEAGLGAVGVSIGGGAAHSRSESHGRRELQASTVHNLSDNVVQRASSIRSLRSSVVTQSQQVERDEVRTRAVENHNRNHAMTVEYFQVLEHYNVHTDLVEETEVLLIPYNLPLELWDEVPSFSTFVFTESERISMLATLASQVGSRLSSYLTDKGENEVGDARLADERQMAEDTVAEVVLSVGKEVIAEESDVHIIEDDPVKLAMEAWNELIRRLSGDENVWLTNLNIKREHFSRGGFMSAVIDVAGDVFDRADPRSESALVEWLDRNAENLRGLVPSEYDNAFDALYRLVHTPEVYEVSKPTVTASNWTIELREAWRPGVTIMVHTQNGQTVTLDHDSGTEGSAVAAFSSPPVDVGAIKSIEINFAPEEATKSVIKSVGKTVDDVDDAIREVGEFLIGQDETPLKEEVEKARKLNIDRFRVTAHTDPMDALPRSKSYELIDKENVGRTLTAGDPAERWSGISAPEPDLLETKTRRYEDYSKVESLIDHIQANRMAYLRQLWLSEDPDKRALRFQQYEYKVRQNGTTDTDKVPLLDLIENKPLGVVGNSVAFRLLDQGQLDGYEEVTDDDLSESKLVSLPTRGVYAETLLSHCNATEIRDLDRMPTERSRCQTEAPEITGVSPGSRRSEDQLQPTLPESTVNLQQPPSAPQPTGLTEALKLLSTPGIFRDMSLGSETVNAANTLAKKALNESGNARQQTLKALTSLLGSASSSGSGDASGGGTGEGGGSGGSQASAFEAARDAVQNASNEAYRRSDPVRNRDHVRNAKKAEEEGTLGSEDSETSVKRALNADQSSKQDDAGEDQAVAAGPRPDILPEPQDTDTGAWPALLDPYDNLSNTQQERVRRRMKDRVVRHTQALMNTGASLDCADLYIAAVVRSAAELSVPLTFKVFDSSEGEYKTHSYKDYGSVNEFADKMWDKMRAINLIDVTKSQPWSDLGPGDVVLYDLRHQGSSQYSGHTRIIVERDNANSTWTIIEGHTGGDITKSKYTRSELQSYGQGPENGTGSELHWSMVIQ